MDCGTALAKQARLNPSGGALRRRVFARPRAPSRLPRGDLKRKAACNVTAKQGSVGCFRGQRPLSVIASREAAWRSRRTGGAPDVAMTVLL